MNPMQTRGRKAYSNVSVHVAAENLEQVSTRSDITAEESAQLGGVIMILRALANQIQAREAGYGKKTA